MQHADKRPAGPITVTSERSRARLKVALTAFPDRYILPSKPSTASPVVQDAFRQTQFLLGDDLLLFERAMNLQLAIVASNRKERTSAAAAMLSFWSRTFGHLADAATLMSIGGYASCPPLLRSALDALAVQRGLARDGFVEYEEWFVRGISQAKERGALAFDLGRYRAGSVLAEDERLGTMYRLLTDLSMPHFGSTAFQTASDSNLQKLAISFGDQAFHLGWAELVSGWLLTLSVAELETADRCDEIVLKAAEQTAFANLAQDVRLALASGRRCYVEEVPGGFLFHNFRRKPGGVPKRLLLAG
jgi:hypothetical protein